MTETHALKIMARSGLVGEDGTTCLAHAMVGFDSIDAMLRESNSMDSNGVLERFGQDGGRAVLILKRHEETK